MKYSLMTPTRERIKLLNNFLSSVEETVSDFNNVEVLLAYDNDDEQMKVHAERIKNDYKIDIRLFSVDRSGNFNRDYYNFLASKSTGDYLMICNDDCMFVTKNWDEIASKQIEAKMWRDRIAYIQFNDGEMEEYRKIWQRDKDYGCFPLVTKEVYRALGEVLCDKYVNWGADIFLWEVFRNANRIIKVPDVDVIHCSHHTNRRERDDLNRRVEILYKANEKEPKPSLHEYLDKIWGVINGH